MLRYRRISRSAITRGSAHAERDSSATQHRMASTLPAGVYSTRDAFPRAEPEMNLLFLSSAESSIRPSHVFDLMLEGCGKNPLIN
jgi:hypothetical protein